MEAAPLKAVFLALAAWRRAGKRRLPASERVWAAKAASRAAARAARSVWS